VGANESTKISLSDTMRIGTQQVPAGTYALYAFPEAASWEIVFHRDTTHWGDGRTAYDPGEDLFRYRVDPEIWPRTQEDFLITFENITHDGMDMLWIWDRTCIRIPLQVDTHAAMTKQINEALQLQPTAQTYYEAARYLQEAERDLPLALSYVERALELGGDTYYFYRVKSLIQAALGSYPEAIAAAQRSKSLAAAEGKDEFVRMNQKNMEQWSEKLKN
jgi:tetratricopeptide (TPR) repeat protein